MIDLTKPDLVSYWRIRFAKTGGVHVGFIRCVESYAAKQADQRNLFLAADGVTIADALRWAAENVPGGHRTCRHCGGES